MQSSSKSKGHDNWDTEKDSDREFKEVGIIDRLLSTTFMND